MSDVILVCESCGDRRSVTEVSLGEICRSCQIDGYRSCYAIYFGKPIDMRVPASGQNDASSPRVVGKSVEKITR